MAFKLTNTPFPKRKDKKTDVDYSQPYEGSKGVSISQETAKKMWMNSASAEEMQLGYKLTKDSEGNFIARTKLSSKA
tara:strand:- start:250 stop:480 length:231 start_codon:yes stop_codon:yes gene_type:complete